LKRAEAEERGTGSFEARSFVRYAQYQFNDNGKQAAALLFR
jgi:hypothetical protein